MKKIILILLVLFPLFVNGQISISNLNEATTINSSDLFLLTQGSSSKKLKYSTLRTNVLSTVIPWSDTLVNGKIVSKYYLYNQLLSKIGWSDTIAPNGKLLKFVENHGGSALDSSKLVTKYDLALGIITPSFSLYTPTYGAIWQASTAGFDLSSKSTSGSYASFKVRGGDINNAGMEFLLRGYKSTLNTDLYIEIDTSGMTFKNSGVQVAKIDSSGNARFSGYIYNSAPHAFSKFMDSTITIPLTQDTWYQITRQGAKTTWPTTEFIGFTESGDTLVAQYSGHYIIKYQINITGSGAKVYEYRIMQKNGTTSEVWRFQVTGTGTVVLRDVSSYLDIEAGSKIWVEIRSISSAPGNIGLIGGQMMCYPIHLSL